MVPVTDRFTGESRYLRTFRQRPFSLTTCPSRLRSPPPIIFVVKNRSCPNPESPDKPLKWRTLAQNGSENKNSSFYSAKPVPIPLWSARHGPGNTALRWRTSWAAALDLVRAQPSLNKPSPPSYRRKPVSTEAGRGRLAGSEQLHGDSPVARNRCVDYNPH